MINTFAYLLSFQPQTTMTTTTRPTILLLKSPSTPEDKYAALFSKQGFNPVFLPVLDHTVHSHNLSLVRSILTADELSPGPQRKYGGLIFTSQRAVEGFGKVLRDIHGIILFPLVSRLHKLTRRRYTPNPKRKKYTCLSPSLHSRSSNILRPLNPPRPIPFGTWI